ncbi:MAG: M48 family metallopeptidase [Cyclobacteriaceae bacterium]
MTPQEILYTIIGLVSVSFVFDQVLDYINLKAMRTEIPEEVAMFYDKEKYVRSQAYHRELARFGFLTSSLSFMVSVLMLVFGGFGWLDGVLREATEHPIFLALLFFGVIGIASDLLTLPFQWYSTFVIEEKYGFNKTTVKTFIADKLKGYVLGALIGGSLLSALLYLIQTLGENFWIWFASITSLFMLFMNMFYTSLIVPLFNKLTPLPEGELRSAIEAFSKKINFPVASVFVIDGSKRSKKANAFFSGIGRKKKIVLYDTLIANHTTDELVAVLAHEVGHYKKKHIISGYVLAVIQVVITLFVLSLMVFNENLSLALGGSRLAIHLNLLTFTILYSPISGITGLLMNMYSRRNEFEADAFAKETWSGDALASALKKLSVDNLSNLYPHPAYVFFHYSHPPLLERLARIEG